MCIMLLRMRAVVVASAEEPWPDSGTPALKGTPEDAATTQLLDMRAADRRLVSWPAAIR